MRLGLGLFILTSVAWALGACSGEDGGDDGDGGGNGSTYGVCTLENGSSRSCIESTGSAANIDNQRTGCLDAGGIWTDEPCPLPSAGACCTYTFGLEFRECVYTSEAAGNDLMSQCMTNFEDCACTPGSG
jgi:hypothetical protein